MKLFTQALYATAVCIALVTGCGGGSGGGGGGGGDDGDGDGAGGNRVVMRDYILAAETVTYTVTEISYVDGLQDFEASFTRTERVDGNTITLIEDGIEVETIEVMANELLSTSLEDGSTSRFPAQGNVGEPLTIVNESEDEPSDFEINATTVVTVAAVLDSFSISTPDRTFQSFNDVLQLDIETTFDGDEAERFVDKASIYYARGVGLIGQVDRDCIDAESLIQDNATQCDSTIEYYTVRVN